MKYIENKLGRQLLAILVLTFDIILITILFLLPNLLKPIYEAGIYNSLKGPIDMISDDLEGSNVSRDVAYIYRKDDKVSRVYYLKSGALSEASDKGFTLRSQGCFLGDVQCILNQTYQADTQALAECELISFTAEEFMQIIEKSHHAARKAISKISEYTATAYNAENE